MKQQSGIATLSHGSIFNSLHRPTAATPHHRKHGTYLVPCSNPFSSSCHLNFKKLNSTNVKIKTTYDMTHAHTSLSLTDVFVPGLTSKPSSSGNACWSCLCMATRKPAVVDRAATYSDCSTNNVRDKPTKEMKKCKDLLENRCCGE